MSRASAYIGLDPSLTSYGISAIGQDLQRTWLLSPKKRGVDRLLAISFELADVFREVSATHNIEDVAMEDTVRSSFASSSLGELSAVTKMTCHTVLRGRAQYPLRVPPTTLKKYATGRGNAKKAEIMLSVYKKWGVELLDDNLADAFVLSRIAAGYADTAYEREVISKLDNEKFRDAHED